MHDSPYPGYSDAELPEHWRQLIGKCGMFEGILGPKRKPVIHYGLPEQQALLVAVWSFGQLPLFVQVRLIDAWRNKHETDAGKTGKP